MWGVLRRWFDARWHWKILGFQCVACLLPMTLLLPGVAPGDEYYVEEMGLLQVVARASLWLALAVALWAWWRSFSHAQIIGGVPPGGRIASAAQGYVRLAGRGRLLEGLQTVFEPGSGTACLWVRAIYRSIDENGGGETSVDESDASFLIDDGSGAVCAVDPEGAEMLVYRYRSHTEGDAQVRYWCLRPGDRIYVLGEFVTLGSADIDLNTHRQTGEVLERWKANRPELLRRFDANKDGQIDMPEWNLARTAARLEVERTQFEALAAPEAHIMRKPRDGQPYLISDRDLGALARQFWWWAIVHGAIFTAAAGALAWVYARGGVG